MRNPLGLADGRENEIVKMMKSIVFQKSCGKLNLERWFYDESAV